MGIALPHLGELGELGESFAVPSCTVASHFRTLDNGGFHEIVSAITMEYGLMGFHVTALCVT